MKNSYKNLTFPELKSKRDELKKKYMEFRFKMVIGHIDNPLQKRTLRRQIARLNTLIHAQELSLLKEAAGQKSAKSAVAEAK
ncbi:MAG: 50S ribosomal protein L29 [Treponema sp.]|nr:50S ribosomal protein L29 [Treponema sp.]